MTYESLETWQEKPELAVLHDVPSPPKHLYYRGTWDASLLTSCVAVVGSRAMTDYGRQVIEKMIPKLIFEGKTSIILY
jgi:predicted Rossmann fold nucleotide-binding protein DprA/Smf involved in DNA uptake